MNFQSVALAYFVIGAVMFGGGAVDFEEAGVTQFFLDQNEQGFAPAEAELGQKSPQSAIQGVVGAILGIIDAITGGIVLVFNLAVSLLGYLNWPITVLLAANAPPSAVLVVGGTFTASFYLSVINLISSGS